MRRQAVRGEDAGRDRDVLWRHISKLLPLRMRRERVHHVLRRMGPLDAAVEPLGVLAEDHGVDLGLVDGVALAAAHEVERVAREGAAGARADVEVEALAHADDRAVVDEALVLQLRLQLRHRLVLRLAGDRAEETELVLGEQVDGALGQRVALVAPVVPADVRVHVLGVESDRVEDPDGFRKDRLAHAVAGHADHCVAGHVSSSPGSRRLSAARG